MTGDPGRESATDATYLEPIVGWRLWQVVAGERSGHQLAAWTSDRLVWPPRARAESHCLSAGPRAHLSPEPGCRCGLYAFGSRELAEGAIAAEMRPIPIAIGRVSLWGRVVKHRDGWRAQYAYPYEVLLLDDDPVLARELASTYAVDVGTLAVPELLRRVRSERRRLFEARMTPTGLAA